MNDVLVQFDFLSEQDIKAFNDTVVLVTNDEDCFPLLVKKANRILTIVWDKLIDAKFIHNGRWFDFTPEQRQMMFLITQRRPSISSFNRVKGTVLGLSFEHPIKDAMLELIGRLTPFVLGVHDLSPKKAYENASLRESESFNH